MLSTVSSIIFNIIWKSGVPTFFKSIQNPETPTIHTETSPSLGLLTRQETILSNFTLNFKKILNYLEILPSNIPSADLQQKREI